VAHEAEEAAHEAEEKVTEPSRNTDAEPFKRAAALAAVAEVEQGMVVGLGTGTTAALAIAALADRVAAGLQITTVATSLATTRMAEALGLKLVPFENLAEVDIAIDGADEIDGVLRAIKGGGGAMLREKIVAAASRRMIAIVDGSKQVTRLGTHPLPVEVLPFAAGFVARRVAELGAEVSRRTAGGAPYRTDQDNLVLDCRFGAIDQPEALAVALSAIPGVLGHGLFLGEIDAAYVGRADGTLYLARQP
jgi:ribose 5-phosphate isomerase A